MPIVEIELPTDIEIDDDLAQTALAATVEEYWGDIEDLSVKYGVPMPELAAVFSPVLSRAFAYGTQIGVKAEREKS